MLIQKKKKSNPLMKQKKTKPIKEVARQIEQPKPIEPPKPICKFIQKILIDIFSLQYK